MGRRRARRPVSLRLRLLLRPGLAQGGLSPPRHPRPSGSTGEKGTCRRRTGPFFELRYVRVCKYELVFHRPASTPGPIMRLFPQWTPAHVQRGGGRHRPTF